MKKEQELCVKLLHCGNKNLANPSDNAQKNIFFMPMGLVALADKLKKSGVDVEIIHSDLEAGKPIEEIMDFTKVDAIGFDCHWLNQALAVMDTVRLVKKIKPDIFTFLGGYSASLYAEEIVANYSQVDAVIRGDADIPIVELCRALQGEIPWEDVQNLVWKDKKLQVVKNPFSYTADSEDLNKLNYTAFHLVRNAEYYRYASSFWTGYKPIAQSPFSFLALGRGCEYACTFCGGNCQAQQVMSNRKKTAVRSIDSIIQSIKDAVALGYETFYVCLEFEGSDAWYLELFERIRKEKIDINFIYGSWGVPSNSLMDGLSETFRHSLIEISPETGNLDLRRKNKDVRIYYTNKQLEEAITYAQQKGNIRIQLYFGFYLEGDTPKTVWESVHYVLYLLMTFPRFLEIEYANFSTDPGSLFLLFPEKFQMELQVHNFAEFLVHLGRNFLEKQGGAADMTLHRPLAITREEDLEIRRNMRLLSDIFLYYRKSVSYILQETGDPGAIVSLLKEAKKDGDPSQSFSPQEIKELLLKHCLTIGIPTETIKQLTAREEQEVDAILKGTLNLPRLFLDDAFGNIKGVEQNLPDTKIHEENLASLDFDI